MKYWTESKTMRLNVALIMLSVTDGVVQYAYAVEGLFDPALYSVLFFAIGVANVILRKMTTTGIR